MDGENNGKPLFKMDDLGVGTPLFSEKKHIFLVAKCFAKKAKAATPKSEAPKSPAQVLAPWTEGPVCGRGGWDPC